MLNDDHKHWKVKTVTSLTHSVYRLYMYKRSDERLVCELRLMPLVWIGGKFWRSPFMNPLDGGSASKNFPWIRTSQPASRQMSDGKALIWKLDPVIALDPKDKTWIRGPWTPTLDRFHGPPVMDQVHGYFFIFIERFWTESMDTFFK